MWFPDNDVRATGTPSTDETLITSDPALDPYLETDDLSDGKDIASLSPIQAGTTLVKKPIRRPRMKRKTTIRKKKTKKPPRSTTKRLKSKKVTKRRKNKVCFSF